MTAMKYKTRKVGWVVHPDCTPICSNCRKPFIPFRKFHRLCAACAPTTNKEK